MDNSKSLGMANESLLVVCEYNANDSEADRNADGNQLPNAYFYV